MPSHLEKWLHIAFWYLDDILQFRSTCLIFIPAHSIGISLVVPPILTLTIYFNGGIT